MKVKRTEKHDITRASPLWKELDDLCFKSKKLYNYANYMQRQRFINGEKIYTAYELDKMIQNKDVYKEFGSQSSQRLLKLLEKNWKAFLVSIKDYSKHPNKYLGKPKIPNIKRKMEDT